MTKRNGNKTNGFGMGSFVGSLAFIWFVFGSMWGCVIKSGRRIDIAFVRRVRG